MKAVLLLILLSLSLSNVKTIFFWSKRGLYQSCNLIHWCKGSLKCKNHICHFSIDDINLFNEQKDYKIDTANMYDYSLAFMIFVFVFGVTFGYVAFNLKRRRSS